MMIGLPIEDGLVRLRRFAEQDASEYVSLEASHDEKKFVGGAKNKTIGEMEAFSRRRISEDDFGLLAVVHGSTGQFLGRAGLLPNEIEELEMHCVLKKEAQGKGYGIATFRLLIRFADALSKPPVAVIHPENIRSQKLFEKLGFARSGTIQGNGWQNGHFIYHRQGVS